MANPAGICPRRGVARQPTCEEELGPGTNYVFVICKHRHAIGLRGYGRIVAPRVWCQLEFMIVGDAANRRVVFYGFVVIGAFDNLCVMLLVSGSRQDFHPEVKQHRDGNHDKHVWFQGSRDPVMFSLVSGFATNESTLLYQCTC